MRRWSWRPQARPLPDGTTFPRSSHQRMGFQGEGTSFPLVFFPLFLQRNRAPPGRAPFPPVPTAIEKSAGTPPSPLLLQQPNILPKECHQQILPLQPGGHLGGIPLPHPFQVQVGGDHRPLPAGKITAAKWERADALSRFCSFHPCHAAQRSRRETVSFHEIGAADAGKPCTGFRAVIG